MTDDPQSDIRGSRYGRIFEAVVLVFSVALACSVWLSLAQPSPEWGALLPVLPAVRRGLVFVASVTGLAVAVLNCAWLVWP